MDSYTIRSIYAINFSIIMFYTPLLYIINHPNIFNIGFDEDTTISLIPFYPLTFMLFKNIARFGNGLALCNNYFMGTDYIKLVRYYLICLRIILVIEGYQLCFMNEINVNIFAITYIFRQYLYGSIDYSLDSNSFVWNH